MDLAEVFSARETAHELGVSVARVHQLRKTGRLQALARFGRQYFFDLSAIEWFKEEESEYREKQTSDTQRPHCDLVFSPPAESRNRLGVLNPARGDS